MASFLSMARVPLHSIRLLCRRRSLTTSVNHTVQNWTKIFQERDIPEPQLSAEFIVAHVLHEKSRSVIQSQGEKLLGSEELNRINQLCEMRLKRMPVQYVIEEWDFLDFTLFLKPPVFIPRPETEQLVQLVLADVNKQKKSELHFLEIGCGSGAISLSLLKNLPQAHCIAIDRSPEAIELTTKNANKLNLNDRLTVHECELGSFIPDCLKGCQFTSIVSNPPYVLAEQMKDLEPEISRYEDQSALYGGIDGVDVIDNIIHLSQHVLIPSGSVWIEVDPSHPPLIQSRLNRNPQLLVRLQSVHWDFSKRPRFCHLIYNEKLEGQ